MDERELMGEAFKEAQKAFEGENVLLAQSLCEMGLLSLVRETEKLS